MAEPGDGQLLLRVVYLSLDPYMRGRMSDAKSYADPVEVGDVLVGGTVCEVVESRHPDFADGRLGAVLLRLADPRAQRRLAACAGSTRPSCPVSTALGVLGMPGFTAYAGLLEIGRPKPGETVVVAAATGPVGLGRRPDREGSRARAPWGSRAGPTSAGRCSRSSASTRRSTTARRASSRTSLPAMPDGIDVYFENVGGAVARRPSPSALNLYARVPVCGLVADYNATPRPRGRTGCRRSWAWCCAKSLTVRGFIQGEFTGVARPRLRARHVRRGSPTGRCATARTSSTGLESAPEAFRGMLAGRNFGKVLVRVSADPTRA